MGRLELVSCSGLGTSFGGIGFLYAFDKAAPRFAAAHTGPSVRSAPTAWASRSGETMAAQSPKAPKRRFGSWTLREVLGLCVCDSLVAHFRTGAQLFDGTSLEGFWLGGGGWVEARQIILGSRAKGLASERLSWLSLGQESQPGLYANPAHQASRSFGKIFATLMLCVAASVLRHVEKTPLSMRRPATRFLRVDRFGPVVIIRPTHVLKCQPRHVQSALLPSAGCAVQVQSKGAQRRAAFRNEALRPRGQQPCSVLWARPIESQPTMATCKSDHDLVADLWAGAI